MWGERSRKRGLPMGINGGIFCEQEYCRDGELLSVSEQSRDGGQGRGGGMRGELLKEAGRYCYSNVGCAICRSGIRNRTPGPASCRASPFEARDRKRQTGRATGLDCNFSSPCPLRILCLSSFLSCGLFSCSTESRLGR